jgi:hypothetical protein
VINNENGILINEITKPALVLAMREMFIKYSNYNRKNISDEAISTFSYETIGKQITNVYKRITGR